MRPVRLPVLQYYNTASSNGARRHISVEQRLLLLLPLVLRPTGACLTNRLCS